VLHFIASACLLAAILLAVPTTLRIAGRPIVGGAVIRTIAPILPLHERSPHRIYNDTGPLNPAIMDGGRGGTSSDFTRGPTVSFGRFTATMAWIHYCFGGGPCVSAAQLRIRDQTSTVVPSFTFLGTRQAEAVYSRNEKTLIRKMLVDVTGSDVDTSPQRVYRLLEQHHQGDTQASWELTECLVTLLHDDVDRE
jgi:hypothetical protein